MRVCVCVCLGVIRNVGSTWDTGLGAIQSGRLSNMYISIYIYTYICVCMYMHVYVYKYIYMCEHIHTSVYVYAVKKITSPIVWPHRN